MALFPHDVDTGPHAVAGGPESLTSTFGIPEQHIQDYIRLADKVRLQPGHAQKIAKQITSRSTPNSPSQPTVFETLWTRFTGMLRSKSFWMDVGIFFAVLASTALLIAMAKWASDGVARCKSRARAFFWWLFLFIGGLILMPTLVIAIPLLIANVFFELFHLARGSKSPGFGWVFTASTFCYHSWSLFGARIFEPRKCRASIRDARQAAAPQEEYGGFYTVELNELGVPKEPAPPYHYQLERTNARAWF